MLVGGFNPSKKYESQLGWWNSQYGKSKKSCSRTTNQYVTFWDSPAIQLWSIYGFFHQLDPLRKKGATPRDWSLANGTLHSLPQQLDVMKCHERQRCFLSQRSSRLGLWEVKVESIHIWNWCNSMILTHRPLRFWFLTMVRFIVMRSPLSVEIGYVKDILTLRKIMPSLATSPRLCQA